MSHNMHASTMLSPDELKDADVVAVNGMCNSVMEYPAINFARNPEEQTLFYDDSPGPYDKWVIEYGYSVGLEDPQAEENRLAAILERSTDPLLQFGNDADDMRGTGRGINPDVNIYDLSSDPVAYASERCDLVNDLLPSLVENFASGVDSHQEVLRAYYALTGEYATQLRVMTRQIGGVRYNSATPAQLDGKAPFTPVAEADQKAAMAALRTYALPLMPSMHRPMSWPTCRASAEGLAFPGGTRTHESMRVWRSTIRCARPTCPSQCADAHLGQRIVWQHL